MSHSEFGKYGVVVKASSGMLHEVLDIRQMGDRCYITYVYGRGTRVLRVGSAKSSYFRFLNRDGLEFLVKRWNERAGYFITTEDTVETTSITNSWVSQFQGCKESEITYTID